MFHTNCISVTSIILQMKSISPPALPILITAGFPIWSINGVEHPEPDLKLENSGYTTTSNPTVITFMQTQGPSPTQYGLRIEIRVYCFSVLFLFFYFFLSALLLILKIVLCNLPRCLGEPNVRHTNVWMRLAQYPSSRWLISIFDISVSQGQCNNSWSLCS